MRKILIAAGTTVMVLTGGVQAAVSSPQTVKVSQSVVAENPAPEATYAGEGYKSQSELSNGTKIGVLSINANGKATSICIQPQYINASDAYLTKSGGELPIRMEDTNGNKLSWDDVGDCSTGLATTYKTVNIVKDGNGAVDPGEYEGELYIRAVYQ
ncbi:hypothetical protein C5J58_24935 [Salmonella enterica]|nr:hypothetical protein [Salmonella enterica]